MTSEQLLVREQIRRDVVDDMFAVKRWITDSKARIECPGAAYHGNAGTDAVVDVDSAPTVYCHHKSCRREVEAANEEMRSRIRQDERDAGLEERWTPEERLAWRLKKEEEESHKRQAQRLEAHASKYLLPEIINCYSRPLVEWAAASPVPIIGTRPSQHAEIFLQACKPFANERWWTAPNKTDHGAGKPWAKRYFQFVGDLIERPELSGRHVCPANFAKTHIKTGVAVVHRKLMVIELDNYSPDIEVNKQATAAVAQYLVEQRPEWGMHLFALVDSGNKSVHAWMTWPNVDAEEYRKVKAVLIGLGADPAFDGLEHSFRMPGAVRINGATPPPPDEPAPDELDWGTDWQSCAWQKLVYLDPSVVEDCDRLPSSLKTHGNTLDLEELTLRVRGSFNESGFTGYEQLESSESHRALIQRENL